MTSTVSADIWYGSSGNLLPGVEARLISPDGKEILEYDTPGELLIRSPSVVLGYLRKENATKETFRDGWMHTGDEAMIRLGPRKTEHVWIVDRIKELIKVKVCMRKEKKRKEKRREEKRREERVRVDKRRILGFTSGTGRA